MGSVGSVEELMMAAETHQAQRKGRKLRQGLGLVISLVCLWLIVRQVRFHELRQALGQLDGRYIAFGLASLGFGYAIRIHRWAVMLRATGIRVSSRACAAPFLGSITLNNVLPFRAGDLVRALVFPSSLGVRRTTAAASLLLERLLDLLTLLLSLGIGLSLSARVGLPQWLGQSVILLSLLAGAALFVVVVCHSLLANRLARMANRAELQGQSRRSRQSRIAAALIIARDLIHSLGQMARPSTLLLLLALSIAVWAGETGLFWALLEGFDIQAGAASALLVMAIATLSTLVPSSPGYVGPFHLAAFSAVMMLGGSPGQAASFAVLAHLGVWLPTTLAGGIAILANPGLFNARASREPSF